MTWRDRRPQPGAAVIFDRKERMRLENAREGIGGRDGLWQVDSSPPSTADREGIPVFAARCARVVLIAQMQLAEAIRQRPRQGSLPDGQDPDGAWGGWASDRPSRARPVRGRRYNFASQSGQTEDAAQPAVVKTSGPRL